MTLSKTQQYGIFGALALMMAATRFHHFLPVADASWALFFVGGFYLRGMSRWAFPALMLEAAAIDYIATSHLGVSSYCMSPAYAFLVPTHAAMWLGGWWLQSRASSDLKGLVMLGVSAFVSITVAFALSNGGFHWFGGREAAPSITGHLHSFMTWYPHFLLMPALYIGLVASVHVLIERIKAVAADRTQRS